MSAMIPPTRLLLTVLDRIVLLSLLPTEGNAVTLRVVREARLRLSFTEEEIQRLSLVVTAPEKGDCGCKDTQPRTTWDVKADLPVAVDLGATVLDLIAASFAQLDAQNKLTMQVLDVYERFDAQRRAAQASAGA